MTLVTETFEITEITHYNPDTCFYIGKTKDGRKVKGVSMIPPRGIYTVQAERTVHRIYGEQWRLQPIEFNDFDAVTLAMLRSGLITGIREEKAPHVFQAFGTDIWRILEHGAQGDMLMDWKGKQRNPGDLLQDAHGVGPHVATEMIASWKEERDFVSARMNAVKAGLTQREWKKVCPTKYYYEQFNQMLHNIDPYNIYDLVSRGVDFEKVDKIALTEWPDKPALQRFSPVRYAGVAKLALREAEADGHLCLPLDMIDKFVLDKIGLADAINEIGDVEKYGLKVYEGMVYNRFDFELESETAAKLRHIAKFPSRPVYVTDEDIALAAGDITLDPIQVDAIKMILNSKVSILTGGPGTGKTTILKVAVELLEDKGYDVTLCAFMGAAARRMQIATGHPASTLHREFDLMKEKEARKIMLGGFLFIDELSTVSSELFKAVIDQLGEQVRIVLIGDVDQLPPVGRGEAFYQLLQSKLPRTRLTTLFRNGGAIARACRDVNNGVMPTPDNIDFFLTTKTEDSKIRDRLLSAEDYFNEHGWKEPQILTPLNDRKDIGRHALNVMFQNLRNPNGAPIPFTNIKVGDMVVQEKNIYRSMDSDLDVRNGMTGRCISRTSTAEVILEMLKKNPKTEELPDGLQDGTHEILEVLFDEEPNSSMFQANQMEKLSIGYAMTVHKSQGNQFPYVFVVLPSNLGNLAMRQIVYTAMSRAKSKLFVLAAPGTLEACIANELRMRRYSCLAALIDEGG